jgi:hypothetical protein
MRAVQDIHAHVLHCIIPRDTARFYGRAAKKKKICFFLLKKIIFVVFYELRVKKSEHLKVRAKNVDI